MSRLIGTLACLTVAIAIPSRGVQAQVEVLFPGATYAGDVLRGEGRFLDGAGRFNLNTATAISILTDTAMRQNFALEMQVRESSLRHRILLRREAERVGRAAAANRARLLESPSLSDVANGDALNILVREIAEKAGPSYSDLRALNVSVPGGTFVRAPLALASEGVVISRARMLARGEWPLLLREPGFDDSYSLYRRAVAEALDAVGRGVLRADSVDAVDAAVRSFTVRLDLIAPDRDKTDVIAAREFIRGLDVSSKCLRHPRAERILADMLNYGGTTVGELVDFMRRSRLLFSPAASDSERELYNALHPLLAEQFQSLREARGVAAPTQVAMSKPR